MGGCSLTSTIGEAGMLEKARMLLRNDLLMESLYAEWAAISEFIKCLDQVEGKGARTWFSGNMLRAVRCNSLFNTVAAGCRSIGNCTGVK